ncbi:type II pantothenate kinase, partial [Staphylococcus aureus]
MKVGIDAGGTLIKIVQEQDNQRTFKTELTKNIDQVVECLNQQQIEKLCLTGGNAGV